MFADFQKTKKLNFTIRPDTPEIKKLKFCQLKAFGVDVEVKGIKNLNESLDFKVTQNGSSEFQKKNGEIVYFTQSEERNWYCETI